MEIDLSGLAVDFEAEGVEVDAEEPGERLEDVRLHPKFLMSEVPL